jgi:hypothetical protein
MPPPAEAEVTVAQLTVLVLLVLVLVLVVVLELDELQAAVSIRLLATAAPTAIACLTRTVSLPSQVPGRPGTKMPILARQVEMMASQDQWEVSNR